MPADYPLPHPPNPEPVTPSIPLRGSFLPGEKLGPYTLIERIGQGNFSVIWLGERRGFLATTRMALKLPRDVEIPVEQVQQEARLWAYVSGHPNIVPLIDADIYDGQVVLASEYVADGSLDKLMEEHDGKAPTVELALGIVLGILGGLQHLHERKVIHRDLKPSNILLDGRDAARVADFGLARGPAVGPELTAHVALLGTAYYMAPEQAESPAAADTRADVYGFGATFYHLLTGRPPFDAETTFGVLFKHRTEPLAAPQAHNPALSDRTAAILERCLAKKPADRFQTFDDLLRHLHPDATATAWADGEPDGPWRRFRDRRAVYLDPAARAALADAPDVYPFADGRTLTVTAGDITQQPRADVIVSPDNELLSMSRGVAKAVRVAAGSDRMRAEVRKYPPVRAGGVVVTAAGALPARFVFHAVTVAALNARVPPSRDLLAEILHGCVHLSDMLGLSSLALSLLGTGGGTFPPDVCLDTLFRFWSRTLSRGATALRDVRVVLHLRERKPRPVPEWAEQGG